MILGPLKPRASGERNIRPAGDVLRLRPDEDDEARDTMPPPPSAPQARSDPWDGIPGGEPSSGPTTAPPVTTTPPTTAPDWLDDWIADAPSPTTRPPTTDSSGRPTQQLHLSSIDQAVLQESGLKAPSEYPALYGFTRGPFGEIFSRGEGQDDSLGAPQSDGAREEPDSAPGAARPRAATFGWRESCARIRRHGGAAGVPGSPGQPGRYRHRAFRHGHGRGLQPRRCSGAHGSRKGRTEAGGGPAALRQYRQQTADREFGILDGQEPGLADIERERTEATRTIRGFQDEAGIDRDQEPDLAGIETEREIDRVSAEVSKRNQRDAATLIEQAQEGTLSPEDVREYQAGLAREAKREAAQEAPTATDEHMAVANAARVRTRV